MTDRFINLDNARLEEQREVMEDIEEQGECPFCPDNLHKYHKKPIIREGEHWLLTDNQWPYEHTARHLLAICLYHAESLKDLKPGAFEELGDHFKWSEQTYKISYGGLALRFGDVRKGAATVQHVHAHLIVPSDDKPEDKKVRFKIG